MRRLMVIAALALAACGEVANHATTSTQTTVSATASIVGAWTDTGDCAHVTHINADGTYVGEHGHGHWTLADNRLTMSGEVHSTTVTVRWLDAQHVELTLPDGNGGVSLRCSG